MCAPEGTPHPLHEHGSEPKERSDDTKSRRFGWKHFVFDGDGCIGARNSARSAVFRARDFSPAAQVETGPPTTPPKPVAFWAHIVIT